MPTEQYNISQERRTQLINRIIETTENNAQNTVSDSTTNENSNRYTWVNDLSIGVSDPQIGVNIRPNVVNNTQIGVNGSDDSDFVVKLPKMDVTTDPLFNDFLRGNRMLKEFIEEWSKPAIPFVKLNIWDRTHYISGSFDWSKTKRGHSYWSSLSTVWRTIVKSLGPEGKEIPVEVNKLVE